jgi:membrane fusion protein, multidrug efflux system
MAARSRSVGRIFPVYVGKAHLAAAGRTVGRFQESTDNAFLQADKVTIAPKVAGFISAVLVSDNQPVKAGDVLATIDDVDYKIAIAEAQADLAKAVAQLDGGVIPE